MPGDRRKEIVRHISEDDLDQLLAEPTDKKLTKRLIFLKHLYKGATLEDAADDVSRSSVMGPSMEQGWSRSVDAELRGGRPRSSMRINSNSCLNCFVTTSHGKNKI